MSNKHGYTFENGKILYKGVTIGYTGPCRLNEKGNFEYYTKVDTITKSYSKYLKKK